MFYTLRRAFTMLELIFVIVILGIVASIGSSMIVQAFESYMMQRAVHSASIKTELAINQIANRMTYYIKPSLVARVPGDTALPALPPVAAPFPNSLPLDQVPANDATHTVLEWIGYDNDGFTAHLNTPTWSGVCDLQASTFANLITPASRLRNATGARPSERMILNNLNLGVQTPAIRFLTAQYRTGQFYTTNCMYANGANGCMFPVQIQNDSRLRFVGGDRVAGQMIYSEFYQLALSAYAIVPVTPGTAGGVGNYASSLVGGVAVWDLRLQYGYQPWEGENYTQGASQLLAHNVSVFRFRQEGDTIRIKLCTIEQTAAAETISICKEKAVFR